MIRATIYVSFDLWRTLAGIIHKILCRERMWDAAATLLANENFNKEEFMTATTHGNDGNANGATLCMALELGEAHWEVAFTTGFGQKVLQRRVEARATQELLEKVELAREVFGLEADCRVESCYEAGREGFWLHRFLQAQGIGNRVVDSSSIEVQRRRRRVKTDRVDLESLLDLLLRELAGSRKQVWSMVRVPSVQEEDRRHLHRELQSAKRERVRVTNRIRGLLACHGLRLEPRRDVARQLEELRQWDGRPLPPGLRARLAREWERVQFHTQMIRRLEAERRRLLSQEREEASLEQVRQLLQLQGIGINSAWLYVMEFFGWRQFRNGKQVGALCGLTPMPFQSGQSDREQGISKAGNRHMRSMAIEIAWAWLRFQPESELSKWYQRRFGRGSKRLRKIGIVALARKLLIALWRFLETGALPEGALLKAEV